VIAVVGGAGPGLGEALVQALSSRGHRAIGLSRRQGCDLSDPVEVDRACSAIEREHGPVDLYVHAAHHFVAGAFLQTELSELDSAWRSGPWAAACVARRLLPGMVARQSGAMVFIGATASLRGSARFSAMAASKSALRGLAQSLERELSPAGVRVMHVVVDGLVEGEQTRARFGSDGPRLDADELAAEVIALVDRPGSVWTHELQVCPRRIP
jgi:NADP-dependent 3-hydroxy acid dehydrogenase YdfG